MNTTNNTVVILGASDKPSRYSYQAMKLLLEKGYEPLPVNPRLSSIDELQVFPNLTAISKPVDTVTVYLSARHSNDVRDGLLELHPRRVIFNPGAENASLNKDLNAAGIETMEACTLVLLHTGQF